MILREWRKFKRSEGVAKLWISGDDKSHSPMESSNLSRTFHLIIFSSFVSMLISNLK